MTDRTRPPWADLPHAAAITALLDELGDLTDAEAKAMAAARLATRAAAPVAEWGAAWRVMWTAADGARRGMTRVAVRDTALAIAGPAARDAALALVVADLVGQHGLTRDHLDVLTAPARTIPRLAAIIDAALAGSTPEAVTS